MKTLKEKLIQEELKRNTNTGEPIYFMNFFEGTSGLKEEKHPYDLKHMSITCSRYRKIEED